MSPFISTSRRRRRRPGGRFAPLAAVSVILALLFAMPAFGGPSALSIAKKALQVANKALKTSKKKVTAGKIVNGAVITPKIANGAVGTTKITNGSITLDKMAANSVGNPNIVDNSVGTAKLIDNSIGTAKVANNSLTTDDIAGADVHGPLSVAAGITSGNCMPVEADATGASPGQVPLFALQAGSVLNNSFIITALKVANVNKVTLRVCWIGAGASPAISAVPVRIITFG